MNSELINKIKTDGIIKLENFLNKEELSDLQKIVKFIQPLKVQKIVIGLRTTNYFYTRF